ncbi:MAG: TetR/AcrR family transcriptional regulator [Microthrixaceae bacterium]
MVALDERHRSPDGGALASAMRPGADASLAPAAVVTTNPEASEILLQLGGRIVRVEVPEELALLSDAVRPRDNDVAELVRAAASCVQEFGVAKTTAEDIADRAGCSRATLYRKLPGGTAQWINEVVAHEMAEVVIGVLQAIAEADRLVDAVSAGVSGSVNALRGRPVLARLLDHERDLLLPELLMERASPVFAAVGELVVPALEHLCSHEAARSIGEWGARLVVARVLQPDLPGGLPVEDPVFVARLAETYLFPGLVPNVVPAATAPQPSGHGAPPTR